jgi:hypothetical protein
MTYRGMTAIIHSYLETKYPGKNLSWEIGLVQKNTTAAILADFTVQPYIWGSPAKHSYKMVFKDILGNITHESMPLESVRVNAWTAKDCGIFLATMEEVE